MISKKNQGSRKYKGYMTIGEVVERLQEEHSDLTISKVRYLEEEGLISPNRTEGGYRKFSSEDVERLQLVLKLQREKFLPLNVIKEKLVVLDKGKSSPDLELSTPEVEDFSWTKKMKSFSMGELSERVDLSLEELQDLEGYNILKPKETDQGKIFDDLDIETVSLVKEISKFGVEPRHLRMYEHFAQKEAMLFQQIILPLLGQNTSGSRRQAEEYLSALVQLSQKLKEVLFKKALTSLFEKF